MYIYIVPVAREVDYVVSGGRDWTTRIWTYYKKTESYELTACPPTRLPIRPLDHIKWAGDLIWPHDVLLSFYTHG